MEGVNRPNLILRYGPLFYRTYYLILGIAVIKPINKIWAEVTTLYRQLLTCTLTMQTYANVYTLTMPLLCTCKLMDANS